MIIAQPELLPEGQELALRHWLGKGEALTLTRVVEAKMKACACKALEDAKLAGDHEMKLVSSNSHLRQAQKYATFIEVLKDITSQAEKFTVVKLS